MKRRAFLGAAGAAAAAATLPASGQGMLPRHDIAAMVAAVTGGAKPEPRDVEVELPALAENGNSVPLRIRVASPMTPEDHVSAIHIFSERNPRPRIAAIQLGPQCGRAELAMRIRMAVAQKVIVLATLSGGRYRIGEADVFVTSAACLDEGP
jgi:sulfur-oxidizing protein SoxY